MEEAHCIVDSCTLRLIGANTLADRVGVWHGGSCLRFKSALQNFRNRADQVMAVVNRYDERIIRHMQHG
jgi:hypothetical protein